MKRNIAAAVFLSAFYLSAFAQTGPAAEVIERYDQAINNRDLKAIMSTLDANATLFPSSGGPMLKGEKTLESFFSKFFDNTAKIDAPMPSHPEFQHYGDIVIRSGESNLAFEMKDGKQFSFPIRTTFVVKNDGGNWHIVHVHISKETLPAAK